jgi:hypothetical protein
MQNLYNTQSTMNLLAIELNNCAVRELKKGHLEGAFQLLTYACEQITTREHGGHVNTSENCYRYSWEDCTRVLTKRLDKGFTPFLYLKFLTVDTPMGTKCIENLCPCGFAWVVWYNLGIVSAVMGSAIGKGSILLKQSLELLQRVKCRIEPEPLSKHWSMLHLSVLNNQACILRDLSMDNDLVGRLVQMGLTLTKASGVLDPVDQELFQWTVQNLVQDRFAAAA